jgi:hypothetical protein
LRAELEAIAARSGRLRHVERAVVDRAIALVLRDAYPEDLEEALVQAVATIVVIEGTK